MSVRRQGTGQALIITVAAPSGVEVIVQDAYHGDVPLVGGVASLDSADASGWYDVTVAAPGTEWSRTFAGHLENGLPSTSDPALG